MVTEDERAHFEGRDAELGGLLLAWGLRNNVPVDGPLDAPGMNPRWIARIRSDAFEADLMIFYGPVIDVSASRPSAPEPGYFVGGEVGLSDERFIEMLNDLAAAAAGGPDPGWLRVIQR